MSLKSIRESYSKLLTTFNDAGIKLSENQKQDVDDFVLALESTMSKQRESAIRKTKKAVTEKLEKEFKEVFESIMKSTSENNILASKIQDLSNKMIESKKIADKVDSYLNLYVESVLPKKTVIDYDKMQKLETIQESLKDLLVVDEEAIKQKKAKLDESFKAEKSKCETEVAKIQVKLNESNSKIEALQKELDKLEAVKILESKTQNLPDFEARSVKKRLAEATKEEINANFKKVLENVQLEAKKAADEKETTLDEEIKKIVDDEDLEENDMLRGRNHNLHIDEDEEENIEEADDADDKLEDDKKEDVNEDEEEFETMESVKFDEDGNVELDEDDIIDENLMKAWCNQSIEVR